MAYWKISNPQTKYCTRPSASCNILLLDAIFSHMPCGTMQYLFYHTENPVITSQNPDRFLISPISCSVASPNRGCNYAILPCTVSSP